MIRCFDRKFFAYDKTRELTWSRWFFPLVNTSVGFREIDHYLQQYIRYIPEGVHRKKNYQLRYKELKNLGYRSLVNAYYSYQKQRDKDSLTLESNQ